MSLLVTSLFFSGQVMRAISWTLVHSLWQGLLLAMLAGIVIMCTGKVRPSLRYNLLSALFVCFLLTTAVTFVWQWQLANDSHTSVSAAGKAVVQPGTVIAMTSADQATVSRNYIGAVVQYCNEYAAQIVVVWFIVFIVRLLKMLSGLGKIRRLRYNDTHVPAQHWNTRFMELARQLGIRQSISLLESGLVKVPVVIGFLKPMVLVPLGLLTNLPPDEAEAILLHELAHIRRRDYFVNLLQSIAETIFFFNPAILWLSSLIREERENCCDDIAVQQTRSKLKYIHALVAFEEYKGYGQTPQPAMAFAGRQHHLLNRVKRIIHNENKNLNTMEKSAFTVSILLVAFLAFMSMEQPPVKAYTASPQVIYDTVPERKPERRETIVRESESVSRKISEENNGKDKTRTVEVTKDGKNYRYKKVNDRLTELSVDGKSIPEAAFSQHLPVIEDIEKDMAAHREAMTKKREELRKKNMELRQKQSELLQREMKLREEEGEAMKLKNEKIRRKMEEQADDRKVREAEIALLKKEMLLKRNEMKGRMMEQQKDRENILQKQKQSKMKIEQEKIKLKQVPLLLKEKELSDKHRKVYAEKMIALKENEAIQEKLRASQQERMQLLRQQQKELFSARIANSRALQADANRNRVLSQKMTSRQHVVSGYMAPLIRDLMDEKVIDNEENLSIALNSNKLVVNGRKQSGDLHQKMKEKYLKSSGDVIEYSNKNGTKKFNIQVN